MAGDATNLIENLGRLRAKTAMPSIDGLLERPLDRKPLAPQACAQHTSADVALEVRAGLVQATKEAFPLELGHELVAGVWRRAARPFLPYAFRPGPVVVVEPAVVWALERLAKVGLPWHSYAPLRSGPKSIAETSICGESGLYSPQIRSPKFRSGTKSIATAETSICTGSGLDPSQIDGGGALTRHRSCPYADPAICGESGLDSPEIAVILTIPVISGRPVDDPPPKKQKICVEPGLGSAQTAGST